MNILHSSLISSLDHFAQSLSKESILSTHGLKESDFITLSSFLGRMLELSHDPGCFERTHPSAHFTASAFVFNPKGEPLALFHKKLQRWLQPGGHIEPEDQSVLQSALREVQEESNLRLIPLSTQPIDLDIHWIPDRIDQNQKHEPGHFHFDIRFAFLAPEPNTLQESDESEGHVWLNGEQLKVWLKEDSIRRAFYQSISILKAFDFNHLPN